MGRPVVADGVCAMVGAGVGGASGSGSVNVRSRVRVRTLEGLKVARTPMYVSCEKAVSQLGLPQHPVEDALARSVRWFTDHGYTR